MNLSIAVLPSLANNGLFSSDDRISFVEIGATHGGRGTQRADPGGGGIRGPDEPCAVAERAGNCGQGNPPLYGRQGRFRLHRLQRIQVSDCAAAGGG